MLPEQGISLNLDLHSVGIQIFSGTRVNYQVIAKRIVPQINTISIAYKLYLISDKISLVKHDFKLKSITYRLFSSNKTQPLKVYLINWPAYEKE